MLRAQSTVHRPDLSRGQVQALVFAGNNPPAR